MNKELVKKCIKNSIDRIEIRRNRMSTYSYITYFCKRNGLSVKEEFYIRKIISRYIDKHLADIFPTNFTINGVAY